jgi:hypothetical protein
MSQNLGPYYPYHTKPGEKRKILYEAILALSTAFRAFYLAVITAWKMDKLCDRLAKMLPAKKDGFTFNCFKVYDATTGKTYTVTGWVFQDKRKISNVAVFESEDVPFDHYNCRCIVRDLFSINNGNFLIHKDYEKATRSLRYLFWTGQ